MSEFGWRILLVEDDEFDRELMFRALKNYGNLKVQLAHDGEEATKIIGEGDEPKVRDWSGLPQLIFLDLKLPKVDGLEILVAIKGSPMTRHIPVVVLSSSTRSDDVARSYLAGANSYVQKPVSFEHFENLLAQVVDYWFKLNVPCPAPATNHGALSA
jgi:two-component system, response regulator